MKFEPYEDEEFLMDAVVNGKVTFKCIQAEVELEILEVDKSLHINKIIREVK